MVTSIQDRMHKLPVESSRFKAMLIVNRRLITKIKEIERSIGQHHTPTGNYGTI